MLKSFFKEFKDFILRGNVMDLAVGVIIGAAFKDIVDASQMFEKEHHSFQIINIDNYE